MANKLKFHLDESVSNAIAKGLRMRGIDITTSPEEGLIGASDKEQLGSAEKVFPGGRSQESGVSGFVAIVFCTKLCTTRRIMQGF
ncbi:MAG: hypothetical protein DWQ58_04040 [Microcystis aeruginosa TA09]|nr:MAG: hypothetical protein DWQ58_04040 [Microcystis aeruginosa TA09]